MKKIQLSDIITILFIVLASSCFILFFSNNTSPLYKYSYGTDSSVYLLLGKSVLAGKLPYVDIWELKGPIIFYIEALGYWLTYSKVGVFCFQVICMCCTLYFIYKTYKIEFSSNISYLLCIFSLFSLSLNYQGGNLIEEFTLPLLSISIWLIYKWSKAPMHKGSPYHNPWNAFVYGVVLGFSLMSRLTDALGICSGVLIIAIYLIYYHCWKNLYVNILYYILGFSVITLPFLLYFYVHGVYALSEMWYGTIVFNLSYAKASTMGNTFDIIIIKKMILAFANCFMLVATGLFLLISNKKKRFTSMLWIAMGGGLLLWYINSNGYAHYGILAMPYTCIIINELYCYAKERKVIEKRLVNFTVAAYVTFVCYYGCFQCYSQYIIHNTPYEQHKLFKQIISNIPNNERSSFVAYNVDPPIYTIGDMLSYYKYPGSQDWLMGMSTDQYKRVYNEFKTCKAKWILVNHNSRTEEVKIMPILKAHYIPTYKKDSYTLYQLKDINISVN